ncbi:tetratricopeptide repeat protein [Luteolibacter algae]|uniref:Tetratricopeptide repeat protein n=1 Tax=Luteolibacter algae TaxID=454151 RepID=A0ABW5D9P7_9BACT
MFKVDAQTQACFKWAVTVCVVVFMQCEVVAQSPASPQFDPSDVYFQAYLAVRAAEQLEKDGDYVGAINKYRQAEDLFGSVSRYYPDWKSGMVKNRRELTGKSIAEVREKAGEQLQKDRGAIAELEGGARSGGEFIDPAKDVMPLNGGILEVDPLQTRRLKDAEAEVERLRKMLSGAGGGSNEAMRNASRVDDLRRQNEALTAKLRAAETNLESLRARMAAAPMQNELKALNNQIERLEQEREAMAMALKTSRGDHAEALSRIEILNADMEIMRQQAKDLRQQEANLQRDLETERNVANEVVAGQRRQMDMLEKQLELKSNELKMANEEIASLNQELAESRDAFNELREERDGLLQERDQMAALLKLNEAGRIEQLIEQNMGLAKSLREANEKVERLNVDNNAAKDDIVDALRDLAIAKSQINRLHQEKREQDKRLSELTAKLKAEESALAGGEVHADPAEVEILREVIKRQLRVQERRRQAKELLVQAARDLGKEDERLSEAIDLFDGAEMELTPEEQRLVADQQVDGEFVSPFARDRSTVGRATNKLNRELDSYDRAAQKAYLAGRLLPTRELLELMLDQNPGHIPALCKLGVVHLKLNEPGEAVDSFRRAIELEENNPYANRMLGYSYLKMDDMPSAEHFLKKAIDMAPDDAKSYLLLGTISYTQGQLVDAESYFKASITADPVPNEPYFNIALLCANDGRYEDARKFYNQALERGAIPDPNLENTLQKNL